MKAVICGMLMVLAGAVLADQTWHRELYGRSWSDFGWTAVALVGFGLSFALGGAVSLTEPGRKS